MSIGLTEGLANFVTTADCTAIGETGRDKAKKVITDTIAVILSGAGSEVAPPMLRYAARNGRGAIPILGARTSAPPALSALVHGTFGAALDFDDVLSMMPGHPAAIIIPALLAGLADRPATGHDFLDAYVIGLEAGSKFSQGVGLAHYLKGFHATGTVALFCGVAALARHAGLDTEKTRLAIGVAASTASGLQANFGTMTKPFHSGWAAQSSVAAVQLVQDGFTASNTVLEADRGFLATYGTEASDPSKVLPLLGNDWTILSPGIALKKFPTCYATHRAIDGVQMIEERVGRLYPQLDRLVCRVAPKALRPLPFMRPETGLQSKFSMPHGLAAKLWFDKLGIASFDDAAVRIPEIRALYEKIDVIEDMACVDGDLDWDSKSYATRGFAIIEAHLTDGRVEHVRIDTPPGHPKRELSWEDLRLKFLDCANSCGVSVEVATEAFEGLKRLDEVKDMAALLAPLSSAVVLQREKEHV